MDILFSLLQNLGTGLATNAIYDTIKAIGSTNSKSDLVSKIQQKLELNGVRMEAETIISALIDRGFLSIQGSQIHANTQLIFGSIRGNALVGNNTILSTDRTRIEMGNGAFMKTTGNAQIRQNPDGSITFHT